MNLFIALASFFIPAMILVVVFGLDSTIYDHSWFKVLIWLIVAGVVAYIGGSNVSMRNK